MNDGPKLQIYRVRDWEKNYEVNRTRELKFLEWVAMCNRMDTDAWARIAEHQNGAAHIGAWTVIVFIASRCEPRGTLFDASGNPHTSASLARQSRLQISVFKEAIPRFMEVCWLELFSPARQQTAESKTRVNGKAVTTIPLTGFEQFWPRWVQLKGDNAYEQQARLKWQKYASPEIMPALLECLHSYESSDQVARHVVMNPDNWIERQGKNHWRTRWAPPVERPSKKDAVAEMEKLASQRIARGKSPLL